MINTRILFQSFEYQEPKTTQEAIQLLETYGEGAKVIAGGTDVIVLIKLDKLNPDRLINIGKISALRYIIDEGSVHLGCLTSFSQLQKSQVIKERYTALFEAACSVSSVPIKSMGTIGGNLCNASPAADSAPPLIAFGARVKLLEMNGVRTVPVEEFFVGPGETVLSPRELLVEIQLPELLGGTGSAFAKVTRVSSDLAKLSVAAVITREGGLCKDCKIVLGAVSKSPMRALRAEDILRGKKFGADLVMEAGCRASEEIQPITDIRSTAWYRREVCKFLVRDMVNLAWSRADVPL